MRYSLQVAFGVLLELSAIACIVANVTVHPPRVQSATENYLARYHRCTVVEQGWPLSFASQYPEGYVNPAEWLAWDAVPIYSSTSITAGTANGLVVLVVVTAGGRLLRASRLPQGPALERTAAAL